MATISNTPRPGYIWDATDNVWYPIGVGAHQHTNAADTPAVMPYSTYAAAGKNKILNGDFAINQRAFTSTTSENLYIFDRFSIFRTAAAGTVTYSAETFALGAAPVSGYEGKNFLQIVTSGQAAASDNARFQQSVEDVRTFAGQTVTISFWARATSGTPSVAVATTQFFNGGSADVSTPFGKVQISTNWTRYSVTAAIPSISGKTIGAGNDGALRVRFYVSAGSDFSTIASSLGVQNNTFQFWGIQAEASSTVTAFKTATGNPETELLACQRYYSRVNGTTVGGATWITGHITGSSPSYAIACYQYPVEMRVAPTITQSGSVRVSSASTLNDFSSFAGGAATKSLRTLYTPTGVTNGYACHIDFLSTAYIEMSAEI